MRAAARWSAVIVLAMLMCGCGLPRTAVMYGIGQEEVPVMQGGRREKVEVDGRVDKASVTVHVKSPWKTDETLAWYREEFVRRGWKLRAENAGWTKPYGWMNGDPCYFATRERCHVGKVMKESMELILKYRAVEVKIEGDYVWDWSGRAVVMGLGKLIEIPGWGLLGIVTVVGGGEEMLAVLAAPLVWPVELLRFGL